MCDSETPKFVKEQEVSGLLSSLGIKTPLRKFPLAGSLFYFRSIKQVNKKYKINKIVNKFLLAGDNFMPEMHLRLDLHIVLWTNYKNQRKKPKIKNQKKQKTGDSQYIYQNELDKAFFRHDMTFQDFKYLLGRTNSDKTLCDKPFNIAKIFFWWIN